MATRHHAPPSAASLVSAGGLGPIVRYLALALACSAVVVVFVTGGSLLLGASGAAGGSLRAGSALSACWSK